MLRIPQRIAKSVDKQYVHIRSDFAQICTKLCIASATFPFKQSESGQTCGFSPDIDFRNRYIIMRLFVTYGTLNMSFIVFNIYLHVTIQSHCFSCAISKKFRYRRILKTLLWSKINGAMKNRIPSETFDFGEHSERRSWLQPTDSVMRRENLHFTASGMSSRHENSISISTSHEKQTIYVARNNWSIFRIPSFLFDIIFISFNCCIMRV